MTYRVYISVNYIVYVLGLSLINLCLWMMSL